MKRALQSQAAANRAQPTRILQRQCACGAHSQVECENCKKKKLAQRFPRSGLSLGAAASPLEQQADAAAEVVMRAPLSAAPVRLPANGGTGVEGELPAVLEDEIDRAAAGGERLDSDARRFFEPRFGHDFSRVRLHRDGTAASLASRLDAAAFAVGDNIFFGQGQYQPGTAPGRRLLAHELAHVVQQGQGLVARQVQRAKISYRPLTWDDFKGSVPAGSPFAAETDSGFSSPTWTPKEDITDTKEECQAGRTRTTKFTAKMWVDPAVFDAVKSEMNQDKSWVKPEFKDPDKFCDSKVTECQTNIAGQAKQATADCKQNIKPCQEAFDQGSTSYWIEVGGTKVTATSRDECSTKLVSGCEAESAKQFKYELTDQRESKTIVTAASKADCTDKKFKEGCLAFLKPRSARWLKHEQGHFDISEALANKARPDLKAQAAKYTATATECGRRQARNAAVKAFNALNGSTELPKRAQDWIDLKDKAQKDYDNDTDHGLKAPEQATWEKDIAAGLPKYDLTKAAGGAGSGTSGTGTTPTPQTTPANPSPMSTEGGAETPQVDLPGEEE